MGSRKIAVLCGVLALVMVVAYGCATGPMLPYEAAKSSTWKSTRTACSTPMLPGALPSAMRN